MIYAKQQAALRRSETHRAASAYKLSRPSRFNALLDRAAEDASSFEASSSFAFVSLTGKTSKLNASRAVIPTTGRHDCDACHHMVPPLLPTLLKR